MVKKNYFDSNMIQKGNAILLQRFPNNYFAADVERHKCLHAACPNINGNLRHKFQFTDIHRSMNAMGRAQSK